MSTPHIDEAKGILAGVEFIDEPARLAACVVVSIALQKARAEITRLSGEVAALKADLAFTTEHYSKRTVEAEAETVRLRGALVRLTFEVECRPRPDLPGVCEVPPHVIARSNSDLDSCVEAARAALATTPVPPGAPGAWPPRAGEQWRDEAAKRTYTFDGETFGDSARATCAEAPGQYLLHRHQFTGGDLTRVPTSGAGPGLQGSLLERAVELLEETGIVAGCSAIEGGFDGCLGCRSRSFAALIKTRIRQEGASVLRDVPAGYGGGQGTESPVQGPTLPPGDSPTSGAREPQP